jgi:uncharacterized protein
MFVVSDSVGERAVRMARETIEREILAESSTDPARAYRDQVLPAEFDEPRGVFVTLSRHSDGSLRGCIGFPLPVYPLRVALPRAAWASAREDPRFEPVRKVEIPRLEVEVSILTRPFRIPSSPPEDIPGRIVVGRDGLIVENEGSSGLLLPQVAPEEGWDPEEFLAATCRKAGLPPTAWKDPRTSVLRFEAEVFHERRPGGTVERRREN